ncbi:hypothetical protein THAOC_36606 [Thalassiosira oceanica]|uniref:Uncharacterized protein n=1 Tax=Thalassiosira oceanica TaxID=159749 RepID=K0QZ82_THAOC|nr:hypothetical protein THAOC_36606 [Thalassiosira oceanica]|eukprot:EJK44823.1 hypothetical protein THAOC_36606 [Thalassiosira oceanica]
MTAHSLARLWAVGSLPASQSALGHNASNKRDNLDNAPPPWWKRLGNEEGMCDTDQVIRGDQLTAMWLNVTGVRSRLSC